MRKHFLFVLMVFSYNLTFSQLKDTVFGKVKSIREEIVFLNKEKQNYKLFDLDGDYGHMGFVSNKATKNRFYNNWYNSSIVHYLNYFKEFDKENNPIKEIWYYKEGDTVRDYEFVYNKKNQLIQEKVHWYDNSYQIINKSYDFTGKLKSTITYYTDEPEKFGYTYFVYNDSLQVVETSSFSDEGAGFWSKIEYDERGRRKRKIDRDYWTTKYNDDGSSSSWKSDYDNDKLKEEYFYDKNGHLSEIKYYSEAYRNNDKVELVKKTRYHYSAAGLLEFVIQTDKNDTLKSFVSYKYDKNHRKIEEVGVSERFIKNKDDLIFKKSNVSFNEVKLPKKELMIRRKLEYKYDKTNLVGLKETETFGGTRIVECKFEYVFDLQGNWIEQIKYVNGEKLFLWKRKINYWDN